MVMRSWSDAEFGLPSVAVAAHELKTPLALIRQMSLLLELGESEDERKRLSRRITQLSEQTLRLVTDVATSANLNMELFPLEPVNPLTLINQMAFESQSMLEMYDRRVKWPPSRRVKRQLIVTNPVLMKRILVNFLTNSVKYSDKSLAIEVDVKRVGEVVRFSVRDFGPAMSLREYRQLLRELEVRKSIRTRPDSSGLGIYVASQFARSMGGRIGSIRHRDGLTFYVDMPLSKQMSLL